MCWIVVSKARKCVLFAMKKLEKCVIAPHFENYGRKWRHCYLKKTIISMYRAR